MQLNKTKGEWGSNTRRARRQDGVASGREHSRLRAAPRRARSTTAVVKQMVAGGWIPSLDGRVVVGQAGLMAEIRDGTVLCAQWAEQLVTGRKKASVQV